MLEALLGSQGKSIGAGEARVETTLPFVIANAAVGVYQTDLYIFGGVISGVKQNVMRRYDTVQRTIQTLGSGLPPGIDYCVGCCVDTAFYVFGGQISSGATNTLYRYDVLLNTWVQLANAPSVLFGTSMLHHNGFLYVPGVSSDGNTGFILRYSIAANTWTTLSAPVAFRLAYSRTAILDGVLYIVGGYNYGTGGRPGDFWRYDIAANSWLRLPYLLEKISDALVVAYQGTVYVQGGFNGVTRVNAFQYYNVSTGSWTLGTPFGAVANAGQCALVGSDFFTFGGAEDDNSGRTAKVYKQPL